MKISPHVTPCHPASFNLHFVCEGGPPCPPRGWTQERIAAVLGVTQEVVSNRCYRNFRNADVLVVHPPPFSVEKISELLDVSGRKGPWGPFFHISLEKILSAAFIPEKGPQRSLSSTRVKELWKFLSSSPPLNANNRRRGRRERRRQRRTKEPAAPGAVREGTHTFTTDTAAMAYNGDSRLFTRSPKRVTLF